MMHFVIYIIVLAICSRYLLVAFSFLPVHFFVRRNQRKRLHKKINEAEGFPLEQKDKQGLKKNETAKQKVKSYIQRFTAGYLRYLLFKVGMLPSHFIRNALYKYVFLVKMEKKAIIYFGAEIRSPENLTVGEGTIIGDKAVLDARRGIHIGKHVNLSSEVHLWTLQHEYNDASFGTKGGPVSIGDRAWIGPRVTILPNVVVGEGAVVAAGAVVTKNVEPYSLVGGIPAKKIGERNRDLTYEFDGKPLLFY